MFWQLLSDPMSVLFIAIGLLAAITVHEFAHAWLADRFGDPTPRSAGRVTLNPLAHLDPLGTLALILVGFGWGKPVPVNNRHFRQPIIDEIQVALAGPFANLTLSVILGAVLRLFELPDLLTLLAVITIQINLVLMVFNLIPIPPLDGSRILRIFLPAELYQFVEQFGFILLLMLFFFGSGVLSLLFEQTVVPLAQILTGGAL